MKIASVSDVHIDNFQQFAQPTDRPGVNSRGQACLDCLESALKIGLDNAAQVFLVNGDLFQSAKPSPVMIHAVGQLFRTYLAQGYTEVLLNPGNHDQTSEHPDHNAMAPLDHIEGVHVVRAPERRFYGSAEVWVIPFRKDAPNSFVAATLAGMASEKELDVPKLLSVHFGLITKSSKKDLVKFAAQGAMEARELSAAATKAGVSAVHMGDWHIKDSYKPRSGACCYQPGALCPASFGDPEGHGHMMLWDSDKPRSTKFVAVPGPQFVTVEEEWPEVIEGAFYRIRGDLDTIARLEALAPANIDYNTVPLTDDSVTEQVARVSHSDNIRETITEYVNALGLEESLANEVLVRLLSEVANG